MQAIENCGHGGNLSQVFQKQKPKPKERQETGSQGLIHVPHLADLEEDSRDGRVHRNQRLHLADEVYVDRWLNEHDQDEEERNDFVSSEQHILAGSVPSSVSTSSPATTTPTSTIHRDSTLTQSEANPDCQET